MDLKNILTIQSNENARGSELITLQKESIFSNESVYKILDKACLQHGSTMQGRAEAVKMNMHFVQKPCILIDEQSKLLFFPLFGKTSEKSIFIQYNQVFRYAAIDSNRTEIQFMNRESLQFYVNYRVIKNQMDRCYDYIVYLNKVV